MEDITKTCYKCKTAKPLAEFNKSEKGTFGVHGHCRECQKNTRHEWYVKHKEHEMAKNKLPEVKAKAKLHRDKKYHSDAKYRNDLKLKNNIRRRTEPAKVKAREQRKRWLQVPHNRIAQSLRKRLRVAINGEWKSKPTETLLGCSFEQAKSHLESKFQLGMTWENYGQWHIDHIIPCSFFDLTNDKQQKMCFNYRNLQPLWAKDNISKCNRTSPTEISKMLNELDSIT